MNITDINTRSGMIGGTLMAILININPVQLLNTAIMAATGAGVSFIVSMICRFFYNRLKAWKNKRPGGKTH